MWVKINRFFANDIKIENFTANYLSVCVCVCVLFADFIFTIHYFFCCSMFLLFFYACRRHKVKLKCNNQIPQYCECSEMKSILLILFLFKVSLQYTIKLNVEFIIINYKRPSARIARLNHITYTPLPICHTNTVCKIIYY